MLFSQNISLFLISSNPLTNSSLPASGDQIWKTLAISIKMSSIGTGRRPEKGRQPRSLEGELLHAVCSAFLVGLEKMAENSQVLEEEITE